jgi:hypothetical protein
MSIHVDKRLVILISGDLVVGSQLKGIATEAGFEFRQQSSGLPTSAELSTCRLVIVDLASAAAAQIEQIARDSRHSGVSVVAFGPHVQLARLQRAREAGCERVATRGSVVTEVQELLASPVG